MLNAVHSIICKVQLSMEFFLTGKFTNLHYGNEWQIILWGIFMQFIPIGSVFKNHGKFLPMKCAFVEVVSKL